MAYRTVQSLIATLLLCASVFRTLDPARVRSIRTHAGKDLNEYSPARLDQLFRALNPS